ncbi:hypothetical protein [Salana multivorans]
MSRLSRRVSVALVALATGLAGMVVAAPGAVAAPDEPAASSVTDASTVSADALPAPQMNGVVWKQVVAGSTVYAVGQFTKARPAGSAPGQNEVDRTNILAYDINTGALLPFAPNVNNQVVDASVSPDGRTLYVAGLFTSVDGQSRYRAAAFDVATGALKSWRPVLNTRASSIVATETTVYIGGAFTTANNQTRTRLVGVDTSTGTVNTPLSATIPDGDVRGVQVSPDGANVVIAGELHQRQRLRPPRVRAGAPRRRHRTVAAVPGERHRSQRHRELRHLQPQVGRVRCLRHRVRLLRPERVRGWVPRGLAGKPDLARRVQG